jgi:hypothetical protein
MNSNEWPLVFFTLFSQASAGIMLTATLLLFLLKEDGTLAGSEFRRVAALIALGLMGLALMISFLHLSRPHASVFAISNLGDSWLSREIVLAGIFFLFTGLVYLVPGPAGNNWAGALMIASGFVGLVLVFSMVRLYMIPTVPVWNNPSTPLAFFSSTVLLGTMFSLVVIGWLANRAGHMGFPTGHGQDHGHSVTCRGAPATGKHPVCLVRAKPGGRQFPPSRIAGHNQGGPGCIAGGRPGGHRNLVQQGPALAGTLLLVHHCRRRVFYGGADRAVSFLCLLLPPGHLIGHHGQTT